MKKGLFITGLLLAGLMVYTTVLTVVGNAVRQPVEDAIFGLNTLPQQETVLFPFAIEDTPLVVECPVCYDGPFTEAEGDAPIANGFALLLRNTSDMEILLAQVKLQKEQQQYCFEGSHIPPQASILLVENSGASWAGETFDLCTGTVEYAEHESLPETVVQIVDADMGAVAITNLTQEPLADLRLYYKNYLPDANIYVGGSTFTKTVETLSPGQTLYLPLDYYASGYSRIMKVEAGVK